MRILQIHARYQERGGEDTVVESEADLLRSAGHEVVSHTTENTSGLFRSLGRVVLAPWNPGAAAHLAEVISDTQPDLAHIHNTWFSMSPSIVRVINQAAIPAVMTLHNYRLLCANAMLFRSGRPCVDCVGRSPVPGLIHRCYRNSYAASAASVATIAISRALDVWRPIDTFVVMTEFAKRQFTEGGIDSARLRVKPHFTSDPGPRPSPPSSSRTVLFVGRLSPEKGILELLGAWERLKPSDLKLVVVGDGPLRSVVQELAPAGVEFTGSLPASDVRSLMLTCRALFYPSLVYESFGMVAVEAMSSGLAVFASAHGAIPDVIGGDHRQLFDPQSWTEWASCVAAVLDDRVVDDVGARGRSRYLSRFTPEIGLENLESLYARAGVGL